MERIVRPDCVLAAAVEILTEIGLHNGRVQLSIRCNRSNRIGVQCVVALREQCKRELIVYERAADTSLVILTRIREFDRSECISRVQSIVTKIEVKVTPYLAGPGTRNDFDPAEAGAAVFGREWVGVDPDFPYLILGRNPAAEKPVNNELHSTSGRRSRSSELRQVGG